MHNDVIKSDIHSTDTHEYSEVIFGLTHLLGFSFAPRIKNFKEQQLYSFNAPKEYHALGYELLPKHRIKELMCYPKFRQVPLKITQPFDILAS